MHSSISYYVQVWIETEVFWVKCIEQDKSMKAGPGFIRWSRHTFLDMTFGVLKLELWRLWSCCMVASMLWHNQKLIPKRGTTSVAWSRVFKHCSFKTTNFKPLKIKQQSYMRVPSLSVWEERAFSFSPTLNDYTNTLICARIPVFASILKHSDVGLKSE